MSHPSLVVVNRYCIGKKQSPLVDIITNKKILQTKTFPSSNIQSQNQFIGHYPHFFLLNVL